MERTGRGPTSLIYLRGTDIMSVDIASGAKERLGSVPSQDVYSYGVDLAVVEDRGGGEDFAAEPILTIRDRRGDLVRNLGAGFSPLAGPDGRLAFLRPTRARACDGETCAGGVEVMVVPTPKAEPERLLPSGDWRLLAWSTSDLVVADALRPDHALLVAEDGTVTTLPSAPNEIWDAAGRQLIVVDDGVHRIDLEEGGTTTLPIEGVLAEGSVSGMRLLAVELRGPASRLLLVSVNDRKVTPIVNSKGAMGPVIWGDDGEAFSYVRADGFKVEAIVCETTRTCGSVLRWGEGISPLALD